MRIFVTARTQELCDSIRLRPLAYHSDIINIIDNYIQQPSQCVFPQCQYFTARIPVTQSEPGILSVTLLKLLAGWLWTASTRTGRLTPVPDYCYCSRLRHHHPKRGRFSPWEGLCLDCWWCGSSVHQRSARVQAREVQTWFVVRVRATDSNSLWNQQELGWALLLIQSQKTCQSVRYKVNQPVWW